MPPRPNPLGQTDMTSVSMAGAERFLSRQAMIDGCDRMIIAYHIGLHCQAPDVVRTLQHAVLPRQSEWPTPPVDCRGIRSGLCRLGSGTGTHSGGPAE
ncbi:hypothetical protein [Sulfobacillus thermosulfidooxidans]|uniref:hypothetical protein n=1 Tax=Sulfobacillus thermosulfidooxidans TaxID=28034 RepID=UPI00030EA6F6|nr:hypothetical protein [Sulfobacillus thermosulfidooxidans]